MYLYRVEKEIGNINFSIKLLKHAKTSTFPIIFEHSYARACARVPNALLNNIVR